MSNKKLFLTDIDGCLLRIPFEEYFALKFGRTNLASSFHWDFHDGFGLNKADADSVWKHIWDEPFFAHPFPGATAFVEKLRANDITVYGWSARSLGKGQAASVRDCKVLPLDGLYFSEKKEHKAALASQLVKDFELIGILEDNIANAIDVAEALKTDKTFLISRSYNKSHDLSGAYKRVDSYHEILVALGIEKAHSWELVADQYAPFNKLRFNETFAKGAK